MKKLKVYFILFILIGLQGCLMYYPEKKYSIDESYNKEIENENIKKQIDLGIDDMSFNSSDTLYIYIHEDKMSKELKLENIKLYDQDEFLGEIQINMNLTNMQEKKYTDDGRLIFEIMLRKILVKILKDKEESLGIFRYYVSRDIKFIFEFYDKEKNKKETVMGYYNISTTEKGWEFWVPSR